MYLTSSCLLLLFFGCLSLTSCLSGWYEDEDLHNNGSSINFRASSICHVMPHRKQSNGEKCDMIIHSSVDILIGVEYNKRHRNKGVNCVLNHEYLIIKYVDFMMMLLYCMLRRSCLTSNKDYDPFVRIFAYHCKSLSSSISLTI